MQSFWTFVTDFGDSALTLPLTALALIFLILSGWRRAALAILLAVGSAGLGIGLLKLALESCGRPLLGATLVDPSGHVALSTAVYGGLALILGRSLSRRLAPAVAAIALIAAIAVSRVLLHAHSPAEVAAGLFVGIVGVAVCRIVLGRDEAGRLHLRWFGLSGLVLAAVMHGTRWPIEAWIKSLAHLIRGRWPGCG